jgi:hypothetical protein
MLTAYLPRELTRKSAGKPELQLHFQLFYAFLFLPGYLSWPGLLGDLIK